MCAWCERECPCGVVCVLHVWKGLCDMCVHVYARGWGGVCVVCCVCMCVWCERGVYVEGLCVCVVVHTRIEVTTFVTTKAGQSSSSQDV